MEDYTNEGKDVDRNMIIIVLYNQACCYQRLSMLDDCSNYLDGTIFNLQQKLLNFENQEDEIKEMLNDADQYYGGTTRNAKGKKTNVYGITDDNSCDSGIEPSPYNTQDGDMYGL